MAGLISGLGLKAKMKFKEEQASEVQSTESLSFALQDKHSCRWRLTVCGRVSNHTFVSLERSRLCLMFGGLSQTIPTSPVSVSSLNGTLSVSNVMRGFQTTPILPLFSLEPSRLYLNTSQDSYREYPYLSGMLLVIEIKRWLYPKFTR